MGVIEIAKPGMLTTIQDIGRWGFQSRGVPVAGPMDPYSHRMANALVANTIDAATLEVTLLGPELQFDDERVVAIAGAEFEVALDGGTAPACAPFTVHAGSRLRFGRRLSGTRAYVAVSGGIATSSVLGSRSTHLISGMGGIGGRPIKAGDRLPLGPPRLPGRRERSRAPARLKAGATTAIIVARGFSRAFDDGPHAAARVRVLAGPQVEYFSPGALEQLQSAPYVISAKSDRMGFRLEGPVLEHSRGADIISDATPLGVLQVPASGQPILLMADRQTTGGYPKIATVITADLAVAGQLGPGDAIRFTVCATRDAIAALIAQERALMALEPRT
jgi:antagonist of KipI